MNIVRAAAVIATAAVTSISLVFAQAPDTDGVDYAGMVEARRALMQAMDNRLYLLEDAAAKEAGVTPFDAMIGGGEIAAMLGVAAFLFPLETSRDVDPSLETKAKPEVWTAATEFSTTLAGARSIADRIAVGGSKEEIAAAVSDLREACAACHGTYVEYP